MWQVGTRSSIAHVDAVGSNLDGTFSRKYSLGTLPNPNGGIESAPVKKIKEYNPNPHLRVESLAY